MFENFIVFIIVALAALFLGVKLLKKNKGQGCNNCQCTENTVKKEAGTL